VRGPTVLPRPKGHWIAQTSGRIRVTSVQPHVLPALITARNEASARLRARRAAALDIPYKDRERTKIDLYRARDTSAHGGYWQRNTRDVFAMLVEGMTHMDGRSPSSVIGLRPKRH
jgi:hypothetical protein